MRFLLDTHILLWALEGSSRLSPDAFDLISSEDNDVFFSAASIWEIAVKHSLRRSEFQAEPKLIADEAKRAGLMELPITANVASGVSDLPWHHRDPFDRLLIAQAKAEPVRLLTADRVLLAYPAPVDLV